MLRETIRKVFSLLGLDVRRLAKGPARSLLGLRHLPIRTVIDIGANTGQFARIALQMFPQSRIICFEPLPGAFARLSEWAGGVTNRVQVFQRALGEDEGVVQMFSHIDHSPSSSLLATTTRATQLYPRLNAQASTPVTLTSLDRAVVDLDIGLQGDILIKLDVQGYENRVIRGGRSTFELGRACIVEVNLDMLYENQAEFLELHSLLNGLGYRYAGNLEQAYGNDGHVIYFDAVFVRPGGREAGDSTQ